METETDGEDQPTEAETSEDKNPDLKSLNNRDSEIGGNATQEKPRQARSPSRGAGSTLSRRTDFGLSPPLGINLLPLARLFDPPLRGIAERLIHTPMNQHFFDTPKIGINSSVFAPPAIGIDQELAKTVRSLNLLTTNPLRGLIPNISLGFQDRLQTLLEPFIRPFPTLVSPQARLAMELGWVIHNTLPEHILDYESEETLDEAIMDYYRSEWHEVRREIEKRTRTYFIDQDSKETMKQALQAHESSLYRLVPRSLVIEIERATRIHLNERMVERGISIKNKIISGVNDLPISSLNGLSAGMIQYETLEGHLYEQIENESDRIDFEENSIPNRHAAVHGLVPYSTEKSSLNSIFLADFVFHVITEMKRDKVQEMSKIMKEYIQRQRQNQS